jgi:hypothetical protein
MQVFKSWVAYERGDKRRKINRRLTLTIPNIYILGFTNVRFNSIGKLSALRSLQFSSSSKCKHCGIRPISSHASECIVKPFNLNVLRLLFSFRKRFKAFEENTCRSVVPFQVLSLNLRTCRLPKTSKNISKIGLSDAVGS